MTFKSITFVLILMLVSCGNQSEKSLLLTENENKGLKEILDFYGGVCDYKVHTAISTENGKRKSFEIEISGSKVVEQYSERPVMAASNIAYLFYKNLKEERNMYDEMNIILAFNNGKKVSFNFLTKQLELVDKRMGVAHRIVENLKNKKFADISSMIRSTPENIIDKDEVTTTLMTTESGLDTITKGFQPLGFKVFTSRDGQEVLHLSGVILREQSKHTAFSIELDINGSNDEVRLLKYDI